MWSLFLFLCCCLEYRSDIRGRSWALGLNWISIRAGSGPTVMTTLIVIHRKQGTFCQLLNSFLLHIAYSALTEVYSTIKRGLIAVSVGWLFTFLVKESSFENSLLELSRIYGLAHTEDPTDHKYFFFPSSFFLLSAQASALLQYIRTLKTFVYPF